MLSDRPIPVAGVATCCMVRFHGPLSANSFDSGTSCHRQRRGDISNSEHKPDHGEGSLEGPGAGLDSMSPARERRSRGLIVECALVVTGWVGQQVGRGCAEDSWIPRLSSTSIDAADESEGLRERAGHSTSRDMLDEPQECAGSSRSSDMPGDRHGLAGREGFAR